MLRRRMMLEQGGVSLPSGYTKIEYLESDGSAGIDTGYKPTEKTRLEFKASVDSNLFIACDVTNASARYGVYFTNNKVDMGFGASGYKGGVISSISYPCEAVFENGKLTINDTTYTFATQSAFTSPSNLFIFGEDASTISKGKIYYLKIYENGVLIRNYIPCTNPNGVRGLYDIVTDQFYILGLLQENVVSLVESTFTDDNGQPWYVIRAMAQYPVTSDLEITITNATGETTYLHIDKGYVFSKNEGSSTIYSKFSIAAFSPEQDGTYKYVPLLDYTRLYFIETDGTTYIDTGFKPNQNSRIVMDVQAVSVSDAAGLFGARTSASSNSMWAFWSTDSVWKADYASSSNRKAFQGIADTDRLSVDYNKNVCTINGVTQSWTAATFQAPVNMTLFCLNTNGTYGFPIQARLYSCQIYDNGTLVRDFIPAMNASGEAGLYDLKNDVWYALLPIVKPKVENKISIKETYWEWYELIHPITGETIWTRSCEGKVTSTYPVATKITGQYVVEGDRFQYAFALGKESSKSTVVYSRPEYSNGLGPVITSISPTEDDTYIYTF